ncbi:MAG: hypothetical protein EAZ31_08450 [Cytophagia bacterium]|nr:MAG: hypothetical protein EAZ31_08450 [Cytophagia bacterium]
MKSSLTYQLLAAGYCKISIYISKDKAQIEFYNIFFNNFKIKNKRSFLSNFSFYFLNYSKIIIIFTKKNEIQLSHQKKQLHSK